MAAKLIIVPSERYSKHYSVVLMDNGRVLATAIDGATVLAAQRTLKGQPRAWARASAEGVSRQATKLDPSDSRAPAAHRYAAALFWPIDRARAHAHLQRADELESGGPRSSHSSNGRAARRSGFVKLGPVDRISWRYDRKAHALVLSPATTADYRADDEVQRLVLVDAGIEAKSRRGPVDIRGADGALLRAVRPVADMRRGKGLRRTSRASR